MLRLLVLALALANAVVFAWGQGYLQPWGWGPAPQSEPHRVGRQIRPEAVRVLRPGEAPASGGAASGGPDQTTTGEMKR